MSHEVWTEEIKGFRVPTSEIPWQSGHLEIARHLCCQILDLCMEARREIQTCWQLFWWLGVVCLVGSWWGEGKHGEGAAVMTRRLCLEWRLQRAHRRTREGSSQHTDVQGITTMGVLLGDGRAKGAHFSILLLAVQQGEPLTQPGHRGSSAFSWPQWLAQEILLNVRLTQL